MPLTQHDVDHMAKLAKLHIDQEQAQAVTSSLNSILTMIDKINTVDTSAIEPMSHTLDLEQPTRDDYITQTDQRDAFQSIAPDTQDGFYIVPQVIEQ